MFLSAFIGFLFSAIVLWFIVVRITKNDEGLDWWDCALWVGGAYVAALVAGAIANWLHAPEVVDLILRIIVGLTVLDWFLRGQYGGSQAFKIIAIFVGVRILFALPWILMWFLSLPDTNP